MQRQPADVVDEQHAERERDAVRSHAAIFAAQAREL
jgi:hypothetical protein